MKILRFPKILQTLFQYRLLNNYKMKTKYSFKSIIILATIFTTFNLACKKTEIEQLNLTGSVKGNAYIRKESVGQYTVFKQKGIKVQIENTDFSTLTDEEGEYFFDNIPSGTYNFLYSLNGYGDMKKCGVQIIGNSDYPIDLGENESGIKPEECILSPISTTIATNLTVEYNGTDVIFKTDISPQPNDTIHSGVFLCIHDNENVAFDNSLDFYPSIGWGASNTVTVTKEMLEKWVEGFNPSKTYYAIAYGYSGVYSYYFDPEKGSYVYRGINPTPTNVVSFKVPEE